MTHNKARHHRALRALDSRTAARFARRCWQRYKAMRAALLLILSTVLGGCSFISYEPSTDLVEVSFQRLEPNSECTATGIELDEIETASGRIESVKRSPLYIPEGEYTFYYYPEYQELTDWGGCQTMIVVTADGEQSIRAVLHEGVRYTLEAEGSNVHLKAM